ncbi:MAG: flavodoxin-dependent (E)-4-hydroxy-3-methylbut-2-enyl-diphosphate synthase [Candidatus Brocadiia bacterium]
MAQRRKCRTVHKGCVPIGGEAPIAVQSMTTTSTADLGATVAQVHELETLGCEIIRVAVPDRAAAAAIAAIRAQIHVPLIADIHFSHRLALAAIEAGADGIRINPGNLRKREYVRQVVLAAKDRGIPIRIGVNSGSVRERRQLEVAEDERDLVPLMVETALDACGYFEQLGFQDIVLSLKASSVLATVAAYRSVAERCDYPLHLGVTAAGPPGEGTVKSALALGILLSEGIGDTVRVSLTGPPHREVEVAHEILSALGLRERRSPEIVACPTCGRCEIDIVSLVEEVRQAVRGAPPSLRVAVMGCVVNGPGEAKDADVGVAGGRGTGYLFRRGRVLRKVPAERLAQELAAEIRKLTSQGES